MNPARRNPPVRRAAGSRRKARRPATRRAARARPRSPDPDVVAAGWQRVRLAMRDHGLLLESDAQLPSVAGLVAGAPVRGSWWGHPRGAEIYAVTQRLADHPDAMSARLVSGKETWVHRRLWSALMAVGAAREEWQLRGLPPAARALLARLDERGELRAAGPAALALRQRLLVVGRQVHTEKGQHEQVLATWPHWATADVLPPPAVGREHGRFLLEEALRALGGEPAVARLPWRAAQGRARRSQQAATPARAPSRRAAKGA